MIEFLCPNGHKIRCPAEQAGKPAKCPRCGVKFRIPMATESQSPAVEGGDSAVTTPELTDTAGSSPSTNGSTKAADQPKEEQIEFLCPKGHHLHGPASLQGRPGECPECGSRFRIPTLEEMARAGQQEPEPELSVEEEPAAEDAASELAFLNEGGGAGAAPAANGVSSGSVISQTPVGEHPLASLFARFWAAKGENSRVEVHLAAGSVLLPDAYVKSASGQQHAVLLTKDPDGSYTVTIVPWENISRVILRGVRQIPGEVTR